MANPDPNPNIHTQGHAYGVGAAYDAACRKAADFVKLLMLALPRNRLGLGLGLGLGIGLGLGLGLGP